MLCRIILVRHRFRAAKGRSMKFRELKKSLAEGVKPIYLITGEDSFFIERSIALICNACLAQPDLNLTRFDGKEIKGETEKLVSALLSYPFMSEKRVVLVKEYYPLAQDLKKLASYFSSPCDTTVFLIADSSPCEGIAKQSNVTVVDCAKGEISLLAGWIRARAGKDGVSFDDRAIGLLIDYCQSDMTRIAGETEKLIAYAGNGGTIAVEDVSLLCAKETEYGIFEAVDFIAFRRYEKAYAAFAGMLEEGDGQKLFASLYHYFRRMLYVSVSKATNAELAGYLKVKEFAVKKSREQAARFSPKRLKSVVDKLAGYDAKFKSGEVSADSAIWNGIFEILIG